MTSFTEHEILSQPQVWRDTLAESMPAEIGRTVTGDVADVLVTGCGSTHYLAQTAAALLRETGRRAWALPASELLGAAGRDLAGLIPDPQHTLLLAVSRSGTTTETVAAVERFRAAGGARVVTLSCAPESPLVDAADASLIAAAARESSVAQTRSFSTMLLLVQRLVHDLNGGDPADLALLPTLAQDILDFARPVMGTLATDPAVSAFFFLGSGSLHGVACEGMLKLKEMSLTSSEAYHVLEFRHGPMSMCDEHVGVLALIDPRRAAMEQAVVRDITRFGPRIVTITDGIDEAGIPVRGDLAPWLRPVLHLLPLQLLALDRALTKQLDPDSPRHLSAVIDLGESLEASSGGPS